MILTRLRPALIFLPLIALLVWSALQAAELHTLMQETQTIGEETRALHAEQVAMQDMAVAAISADPAADMPESSEASQAATGAEEVGGSCESEVDEPESCERPESTYTDRELEMIAQTVWGEARGCHPDEQRLVIWTIFQQVDADGDFAKYDTITKILTKPHNFAGYREAHPVDPDIFALVCEEAARWSRGEEPPTLEPYAPTLPYLFFDGDGKHNWFRAEWKP